MNLPPRKLAQWKIPTMNESMHFLLKMGISQLVILVFGGVVPVELIWIHTHIFCQEMAPVNGGGPPTKWVGL